MTYPPPQHPQDPWGSQGAAQPQQGARQSHARPGYGPQSGTAAPWPGHGPQSVGQAPGQPGNGPQPRQGGPPPGRHGLSGLPHEPQDSYGWPAQYGQDDLYGMPQHDYNLPPKRNNTLIIGLSVGLGVILLAGGTAGAVTFVNSSGDKPPAALPSSETSFPTTAPWQSDPPSADPSDEPSDGATEPATDPTEDPSTSDDAGAGGRLAHTEFDDWRFDLAGIRFSAKKVAGWTYDSCEPVDGQGVLGKNKCESAIQVAYTAYRGHLKAVQLAMAFPSEKAAKAAADRLVKAPTNAVNFRSDMTFASYAYGGIRTNPAKNYVVVTIVTADKTAKAKADKFHVYLQADTMAHFMRRDVTVTS